MSRQGVIWIGWPGVADVAARILQRIPGDSQADLDYPLKPVVRSEDEVSGFYEGFSNEVLRPLFHDFLEPCKFQPDYWQTHQQINR